MSTRITTLQEQEIKEMTEYLEKIASYSGNGYVLDKNFLTSFSKNKKSISITEIVSYYLGRRATYSSMSDDEKSYVLTELFNDIVEDKKMVRRIYANNTHSIEEINDDPPNVDNFKVVVKTRIATRKWNNKDYIVDTTYMIIYSPTNKIIQMNTNSRDKIDLTMDDFLRSGPLKYNIYYEED